MRFRVVIPLPVRADYIIEAPYPEAAKREASRLHKPKLPRVPIADIANLASCFRVNSKSPGSGKEKSHEFEEFIKEGLKDRDL